MRRHSHKQPMASLPSSSSSPPPLPPRMDLQHSSSPLSGTTHKVPAAFCCSSSAASSSSTPSSCVNSTAHNACSLNRAWNYFKPWLRFSCLHCWSNVQQSRPAVSSTSANVVLMAPPVPKRQSRLLLEPNMCEHYNVPSSPSSELVHPLDLAAHNAHIMEKPNSFLGDLNELKRKGWYWGPLTRVDAAVLLDNRPDGAFLVRDSSHPSHILTLSVRVNAGTYHIRIVYAASKYSLAGNSSLHSANSIVELIDTAVDNSKNHQFHYFMHHNLDREPPVRVTLLYPLSRYRVVSSLKHLCRFEILNLTRADHINELPLPPSLQRYLSENQCYAEDLDQYVHAELTQQ